ncbi:hypothetical protein [Streptomyces sp. SLBN-115]|uniref:hypothetical protein n=1 Tax=Streptomyces sp. SLBN-115 TaxID=2768453 RepID=UPI00115389C9|nr:hypothetical protein [Streptomyces sp. SLBN-115]TQJ55968.1 hypothetical protein FBY34_3782 [Streptomyces sp. SLBN-115]
MPYTVDLAFRVEETLDDLSEDGRQEIMETIAAALVRPDWWPEPGGWRGAFVFGPRSWMWFTAFLGGIEVIDVGWAG